ncbi:MAG: SRPBCC domain-containing protein, partial [Chloroflexota bacterium]
YRITRRIDVPREQAFRAFTDPRILADWMDASGVTDLSGPLDRAGTSYTLVIAGPWRFRSEVIRVDAPHLHETAGRGLLGAAYRMVATLEQTDGGTELALLTEYTVPLGPIGRWIDRRWIDREPRTASNREFDRLVALVSDPSLSPQPHGASRSLKGVTTDATI